jgi:hypothetical protein
VIPAALAAAIVLSALAPVACAGDNDKIRSPAVAGGFYPADPEELAGTVDRLLASATSTPPDGRLIALICPHAGYAFSGPVAAESYATLRGAEVDRVVVIAPSHVEAFRGAAVYDGAGYATPLGVVEVDTDFGASTPSRSSSPSCSAFWAGTFAWYRSSWGTSSTKPAARWASHSPPSSTATLIH